MTILFAPEAEADFRALVEYLQSRNPVAAAALADRIFAVIDHLASGDFEGPEQTLLTGDRPAAAGALASACRSLLPGDA